MTIDAPAVISIPEPPTDDADHGPSPAAGYANPAYARSLSEFGTPLELPRSGGWLLERTVPGTAHHDAIGGYPLFSCTHWAGLAADLDSLEGRLVSACAVPELFGAPEPGLLREAFRDIVVPFKEHFVTDMHRPLAETVSRHHRKYARKALQRVEIDVVADPPAFIDEWMLLHRTLVARHDVRGLRAFSRRAFEQQLRLPDVVVLRARHGGATVGAQLWLRQRDVAYGHVLAFSPTGYEVGAPYALYWSALEHFVGKVRWCSFGGVSGTDVAMEGGLGQFKRGWASGTRTAYFCGRILDRARYEALAAASGCAANPFFPAYRTSIG